MSCDSCQAMNDRLVEVTEANTALQNSLVDANRRNGRLQAELSKLQQADALPEEVREVFAEWQHLCCYPNLSLVESRRKLIVARLNEPGCDVEKLKRAIYGYSRFPYTGPRGRSAVGSEEQRYDEIKTIFRDGDMVDAGVKLAVRADREDASYRPGEVPWPVGLFEPGEVIQPGPDGADRVPLWVVPCPAHGDGKTLRAGACMVRWGQGGIVRAACTRRCGDIVAAFERLRDGKPLDQMDLGVAA